MRNAIPTAEQFNELISALSGRERLELDGLLDAFIAQFLTGETLTVADAGSFLDSCAAAIKTDMQAVQVMPAFKWLDTQQGIGEAFKSMSRARKREPRGIGDNVPWTFESDLLAYLVPPTRDEARAWVKGGLNASLTLEQQEQRIDFRMSLDTRAITLRRVLQRRRDRTPYPALKPIAVAFSGYFHANRPAELRELQQSLEAVTARSEDTMRGMLKAAQRHPKHAEDFEAASLGVMRNGRRLDRLYFSMERDFRVAQRNDAHAKERMLVHDLHYGLRRTGWRPGAAALADFLTCEGVANRLDTRTIERHLAQWKQMDADRKMADEKKS